MPVELNHTIVHAREKRISANFFCEILGLPKPAPFGPFLVVRTSNNVSLDFIETSEKIQIQHYAFLVSEEEFDDIFARIRDRGIAYYPGPEKKDPGQINHHFGGRGVYFEDPSGNYLEVLTRPYPVPDSP